MTARGGGKKIHTEKHGFETIKDMIQHSDTEFRVLTATSLFGFMLRMNVSKENAEYLAISKVKFAVPITQYLLKLSIISDAQRYLNPIILEDEEYDKMSETVIHFYKEAKVQQHLWLRSIEGGKQPVCPDVYAVSYDCGNELFNNGRGGVKRRNIKKEIFDYLKTRHNDGIKIGAIAMEYIQNSTTLYDIINGPKEESFKNLALITAGAQVIRLFIDHEIVHLDLHAGNILVDESGMSYIIDFGMVIDLGEPLANNYGNKEAIKHEHSSFYSMLHNVRPSRNEEEEKERLTSVCERIFDYLRHIESTIAPNRFQMVQLYSGLFNRDLLYDVIMKYYELSRSPDINLSRKTINKKIDIGEIELIQDDHLDAEIQQQQQQQSYSPYLSSYTPTQSTVPIESTVPIQSTIPRQSTVPIQSTIPKKSTVSRKSKIIKRKKTITKKR